MTLYFTLAYLSGFGARYAGNVLCIRRVRQRVEEHIGEGRLEEGHGAGTHPGSADLGLGGRQPPDEIGQHALVDWPGIECGSETVHCDTFYDNVGLNITVLDEKEV
eukprot:CAMPEP_0204199444 /NCGR_PEP_ID=MMETSP0361-20130328/66017_1 /ASSEMBLY_ACC=CAM_ASM_000343 /TAXON_ID=268821 /ORGANISM="Scrippsiella Hangoei, Strain SHTV-5" /LENGTH=105 /DNA_ID=CAMNT_0051161737 /DNA_START=84 /DNA_END=402 /DNA_ORIENTATION=+